MAKRGKKGGKKSRKYKSAKRVAAGKRAYKKSGLYKYNMKKKHGKKKGKRSGRKSKSKGKGKKYKTSSSKQSRKYERKAKSAGVPVVAKSKIQDAYRRVINKGGSEEHARAVVARLERMRMGQIRKGVLAADAKQKAAEAHKKAASFADLFRKIGAEEARRARL